MARGRRPVDPEVAKLKGNPGKRAIRKAIDNGKLTRCPAAPDHLPPVAAGEWRRLAPILFATKRLTPASLRYLEQYCFAYHKALEAQQMLEEEGTVHLHDNKGHYQSPWWYVWRQSNEAMKRLSDGFGLLPMDALRFSSGDAGPGGDDGNPYDALPDKPKKAAAKNAAPKKGAA